MISDVKFPPLEREKIIRNSLMVGGVWILFVLVGWFFQPDKFYRAYLLAWLFWLGVSLGALAMVMLHHLMGGEWGFMIRRLGEHAAMTLPLLVVLFVPIAIGLGHLYPWARPEEVANDPILRHEGPYLNVHFFLLRFLIYAVVWVGMAWYLRSASLSHDRTSSVSTAIHMHNVSAGGMAIYFITMSFASVDWIMSLEPHWISTVFGFMIVSGQAISGLCVLIVCVALIVNMPPFREKARKDHFNDLGNLLLTLVILWAYLAFAQLLVIWMGNKQDEIPWYVHRLSLGWWWIGLMLVVLHFFVPFIILLMRELKRKVSLMLGLCAGLLVLRLLDLFWQTGPSGEAAYISLWHVVNWMDLVFPIGMGGLWVAMFFWLSLGHPLMPEGAMIRVSKSASVET